jgi:hypothetical protein
MFLAPAVPAGVVHANDVDDRNVTDVQTAPPTVTVAPLTKFEPVMVIGVPPLAGPFAGDTDVTVGAGSNVNAPTLEPVCVFGLVTTMSRAPTVPAGVRHVNDVDDTNVTEVQAAPPTVTVAPLTKPVPVIEIVVPPLAGPFAGEAEETVGGVPYTNPAESVLGELPTFVTTTSDAPDPEGVVQVKEVDDTTFTEVHGTPPTVTVAPLSKLEPAIVMDVPPTSGPKPGVTDETEGCGAAVIVIVVVFLRVPMLSSEKTILKTPTLRPTILKPPEGSSTGNELVDTALPLQSVRDQELALFVE